MAINEIKLPGITETAQQNDNEIFYAMKPAPLIKGGTVAKIGAGLIIQSGQVMSRLTAVGVNQGKLEPYTGAGGQVAVCVLQLGVSTVAADQLGSVVFGGVLKLNKLIGLDAAAITALGGTVDSVMGFFKF